MTDTATELALADRLTSELRVAQALFEAFRGDYRGRSNGSTCEDGRHGLRCLFGRDHAWSVWYEQGRIVRTSVTYRCHTCGAVCTAEEVPAA